MTNQPMNSTKDSAMKTPIDPSRVFLVSGQIAEQKVGRRDGLGPTVHQRVVFADDAVAAYQRLATAEPAFKPIGLATLADYEDSAARLRAVAEGRSQEWALLEA